MSRRRVLAAIAAAVIVVIPSGNTASQADIVDDIIHDLQQCAPWANPPVLNDYQVQGEGGVEDCLVYLGFTVCLDYMYRIQELSCKPYNAPATSGKTRKVDCLPGVWATTVLIHGPMSTLDAVTEYVDRHSDPEIFINDCLRPLDIGP